MESIYEEKIETSDPSIMNSVSNDFQTSPQHRTSSNITSLN